MAFSLFSKNKPFQLKYLFVVEYTDGTTFKQTKDDISVIDPQRSCFYDVLQSGKTVKRFSLVGGGEVWAVDLTDGHFYHNDQEFLCESEELKGVTKFDLVFFRQHQHDTNVTYELKTGQVKHTKKGAHRTTYCIGWQMNVAGKNYQQIIKVV